ncbi:chryseobasin-related MNIO class RiPP peptide [Taibaiella koreensis]|uniref:chryseobasin-related MNIO class RiPP peptide n=1 Tax=Taibaiella koreensis TaxID=1268548 RepID=UPI0013C2CF3B|nr:hypothetical protein [Taibaiella koreensis]
MKVSKALLGAILVGITVQTAATSCSKKETNRITPQTGAQAGEQVQPPHSNPEPPQPGGNCPGCGMG